MASNSDSPVRRLLQHVFEMYLVPKIRNCNKKKIKPNCNNTEEDISHMLYDTT